MQRTFLILTIALLSLAAGWWLRSWRQGAHHHGETVAAQPKPLFYQSPMHPWIRSDQPGQCTICGMDLAPVFEAGGTGGDVKNVVVLPVESPRIVGIATQPVRRGDLVRKLRVSGRLVADERKTSYLAAPVRGRIDRLNVGFVGSEVKEGEPLLRLFSRELLAALSEYRLAPNEALRKAVGLRLRQMGLSEGQIDAIKGVAPSDSPELGVPIVAPRTGTVIAKKVLEGQWVDEGEVMLEIADLNRIWFVFPVYERDLPAIAQGLPVSIRTPSHPGEAFHATVSWLEPTLEAGTRTVLARAELDNPLEATHGGEPRRRFLHQLFAEATVERVLSDRLLLPRSAVIWPGGEPRVFVDEGEGHYRMAQVTLGQEGETEVEVLAGVSEGARVVTRGAILLDGQAQLHAGYGGEEEPAVVGERCPVSGEKLGSMGEPFRFVFEEKEVALCCESCRDEFESDAPTFLKKLLPAVPL